jgi:hypothetical protein
MKAQDEESKETEQAQDVEEPEADVTAEQEEDQQAEDNKEAKGEVEHAEGEVETSKVIINHSFCYKTNCLFVIDPMTHACFSCFLRRILTQMPQQSRLQLMKLDLQNFFMYMGLQQKVKKLVS